MAKNGYSRKTLTGYVNHYDSTGKKTGYSRPGLLDDTWVHYDDNGKRIGVTRNSLIGGTYTTDTHGKTIGRSRKNLVGGTNYYDAHGNLVGRSHDNLVGGSIDSEGFANQTSTRSAEHLSNEGHEYSSQSSTGSKWFYIILTVILIALGAFIGKIIGGG